MKRVLKKMKINGINIEVELPKELAKEIPNKLESSIRIKDEKVAPISRATIMF